MQNSKRKFYSWEKIYKSKVRYKTVGENFILGEKISEMKMHVKNIWRKCYRKFENFAKKKSDKLSIMD